MSSHLKKSKNNVLVMALILFVVTAVFGGLLAVLHHFTAPVVARSSEERVETALQESFDNAVEFKAVVEYPATIPLDGEDIPIKAVYSALDSQGEFVGYCINTAPKGYVKEIDMLVAIDRDGYVYETSVLSISETPGSGLKVQSNEKFQKSLIGINDTVKGVRGETVKKGEVEIISGATVSSKAYINGVNAAVEVAQLLRAEEVLP